MASHQSRRKGNSFLRLIHPLLDHPNFYTLSPRATKLLITLAGQYRGTNNGDLCATFSVLKSKGWTSNDQIRKGLNELLERGFIIKTRQGRRPNVASLYAITWEAIDECGGKLEVKSTKTALNNWKKEPPNKPKLTFSDHRHTVHTTPPHGGLEHEKVVSLHRHTVHREQK